MFQLLRVKNVVQVIYDACACKFQDCFLLRPKPGEGNVGGRVGKDGFRLLWAHRVTDQAFLFLVDVLDVQATRAVADEASDSLLAMTDAEMYVGMVFQEGLAVLVEFKRRLSLDAEAEAKFKEASEAYSVLSDPAPVPAAIGAGRL